MTGSTRDLILISLVTVILLAAWIVLVFYADAHPEWRREDPARPPRHGRPGGSPAGRPKRNPDAAPEQTRASPSPARDTGVPGERAPTVNPDMKRAPDDHYLSAGVVDHACVSSPRTAAPGRERPSCDGPARPGVF